MERRESARLVRFIARSIAALAPTSQPADLAERQRQSAAQRSRTGLSGHRERNPLAEAGNLFRDREENRHHRRNRRKNERPVRLRSARLLAAGYQGRRRLRFQY